MRNLKSKLCAFMAFLLIILNTVPGYAYHVGEPITLSFTPPESTMTGEQLRELMRNNGKNALTTDGNTDFAKDILLGYRNESTKTTTVKVTDPSTVITENGDVQEYMQKMYMTAEELEKLLKKLGKDLRGSAAEFMNYMRRLLEQMQRTRSLVDGAGSAVDPAAGYDPASFKKLQIDLLSAIQGVLDQDIHVSNNTKLDMDDVDLEGRLVMIQDLIDQFREKADNQMVRSAGFLSMMQNSHPSVETEVIAPDAYANGFYNGQLGLNMQNSIYAASDEEQTQRAKALIGQTVTDDTRNYLASLYWDMGLETDIPDDHVITISEAYEIVRRQEVAEGSDTRIGAGNLVYNPDASGTGVTMVYTEGILSYINAMGHGAFQQSGEESTTYAIMKDGRKLKYPSETGDINPYEIAGWESAEGTTVGNYDSLWEKFVDRPRESAEAVTKFIQDYLPSQTLTMDEILNDPTLRNMAYNPNPDYITLDQELYADPDDEEDIARAMEARERTSGNSGYLVGLDQDGGFMLYPNYTGNEKVSMADCLATYGYVTLYDGDQVRFVKSADLAGAVQKGLNDAGLTARVITAQHADGGWGQHNGFLGLGGDWDYRSISSAIVIDEASLIQPIQAPTLEDLKNFLGDDLIKLGDLLDGFENDIDFDFGDDSFDDYLKRVLSPEDWEIFTTMRDAYRNAGQEAIEDMRKSLGVYDDVNPEDSTAVETLEDTMEESRTNWKDFIQWLRDHGYIRDEKELTDNPDPELLVDVITRYLPEYLRQTSGSDIYEVTRIITTEITDRMTRMTDKVLYGDNYMWLIRGPSGYSRLMWTSKPELTLGALPAGAYTYSVLGGKKEIQEDVACYTFRETWTLAGSSIPIYEREIKGQLKNADSGVEDKNCVSYNRKTVRTNNVLVASGAFEVVDENEQNSQGSGNQGGQGTQGSGGSGGQGGIPGGNPGGNPDGGNGHGTREDGDLFGNGSGGQNTGNPGRNGVWGFGSILKKLYTTVNYINGIPVTSWVNTTWNTLVYGGGGPGGAYSVTRPGYDPDGVYRIE